MNFIIFGGTGFFGRAFVEELQEDPSNNVFLVARDRFSSTNNPASVTYADAKLLKDKSEFFDQVFDFSSRVSVDDFLANPQVAFLENLEILIKNIKFLNEIDFSGRYVYVTTDRAILNVSDAEYASDVNINNDPYGASKLMGEMIARYSYSVAPGVQSAVRFPNLYGPGQTSKQLVPSIIKKIKSGFTEVELTSLDGARNYLFISDAVDALIKLANAEKIESDISFSGKSHKIRGILKVLKDVCSQNLGFLPSFVERPSGLKRSLYKSPPSSLDDRFFRKKYNWAPRVDLQEGLLRTFDFDKRKE